jgi:RHS repeat-associated protein
MDRVATRTDALLRAETYTYDGNGNLLTTTDRKGQVTMYGYDALNRQTSAGFGAAENPPSYVSTITTIYDAADRLTTLSDSAGGTVTLAYDSLDRVTSEVTPEGSVTYAYDGGDRRTTLTVAGQPTINYTYDDADRLTTLARASSAIAFAYDAADRQTLLTMPNGVSAEYLYDANDQVAGLTYKHGTSTLGTLSYAYDAKGQKRAVGGTFAQTPLPAAIVATYDDGSQIATWGGVPFTYDQNGNLTSDGTRSYIWNERDELASVSGVNAATFAYDGFGRRRQRTVNGTTTAFLYDGLNVIQELVGGTATANLVTGLGLDEFFSRVETSSSSHFLTDALGSTVSLSDGAGVLQTTYAYEPFGTTTVAGGGTTNTIAFAGRENDATGLYFNRARYYDPRLQRFISEDPSGFVGGLNHYVYANNQPTLYTDPLGLKPSDGFGDAPLLSDGTGGANQGSRAGGSGARSGAGGRGAQGDRRGPPPGCRGQCFRDWLNQQEWRYGAMPWGPSGAAALRALFGRGLQGIEALLARLLAGERITLPPGITAELLRQYREVAVRAIESGRDTTGVQALRVQAIDHILRMLGQ